jgi:hypothetical protein
MRRLILALCAAASLTGCVSYLDSAYDNQARDECEQAGPRDRAGCYDRVDQHARDRDRQRRDD